MLPTSKNYLVEGGYSPKAASYLLIGLFIFGVIAIQILSRIIHRYMPSHVVDCDHTHDEEAAAGEMEEHHHHHHDHEHHGNGGATHGIGQTKYHDEDASDEDTPLLARQRSGSPHKHGQRSSSHPEMSENPQDGVRPPPLNRRPSFVPRTLTKTFTALTNVQKSACDETGPCMGYSSPCGADCFSAASRRGSLIPGLTRQASFPRGRNTLHRHPTMPIPEVQEEESAMQPSDDNSKSRSLSRDFGSRVADHNNSQTSTAPRSRSATHHYHHPPLENGHAEAQKRRPSSNLSIAHSHGETHHHHVPTNAFMNIGLQTSIAIALHKLPEGFITYATNHANPTLGFAVFMALFIHNITEGFAMALPLYLALNSRLKAMLWSSFLGGASQPLGAGLAALWFHVAGEGTMKPGDRVYGGMFAVTAGVMTSVALSLFSESLAMTHNRGLCIVFAFVGMGILGFSFALTAK